VKLTSLQERSPWFRVANPEQPMLTLLEPRCWLLPMSPGRLRIRFRTLRARSAADFPDERSEFFTIHKTIVFLYFSHPA
jgi:hypothetical protein